MKQNISILLILVFSISFSFAQIPVNEYRKEINKLKSGSQLSDYWSKLYKIDQEILVHTSDIKMADSISISNMIRTALVLEIHGIKAYNPNGFVPILNLSHNYIGQSQLAYWPIIERCAEVGGAIESFGGKYPAYQLESVSLTFYNYSLFQQEEKYSKLLNKLGEIKTESVVDALLKAFNNQNKLRELSETEVLHYWYLQSSKDRIDKKTFSFVKMSDGNIYKKSYDRIQKLKLIKTNSESKIYQIENEPFDWKYIYRQNGDLTLVDDYKNELIKYTIAK
ncbi:hypothetical protein [Winogradskyella sp. PE311]|uniref:hypothetical protein n=1 Tax=Winogradskyella sp. PE311 TaxID=3366943 RepID=UPI003981469E